MLNHDTTEVLKRLAAIANESYLVGGAVRDLKLQGEFSNDLDIAVRGDGFAIASALMDLYPCEASFVPLDAERGTGRLVLGKPARTTLDISSFKGEDVLDDLRGRDFTINAMAMDLGDLLHGAWDKVLDPLGGKSDLENRCIRACSKRAFSEDPVRILRAYRFRALLGFSIHFETLERMSAASELLPLASWERIRDELMAILDASEAFPSLSDMDKSGIMDVLFPELLPMRGCQQNDYHHLDVWNHTMEMIRRLEHILASPETVLGSPGAKVALYAESEIVSGRSRNGLLKLAALFHDSGKPRCAEENESGRIRFIGHEGVSHRLFEAAAKRLKLSKREIRTGSQWVKGHMRPMILTTETVSKRAMFRLNRHFGDELVGLMILFLADLAATQGPARRPESETLATKNAQRMLEYHYGTEESHVPRLLRGTDLMSLFGLEPGPRLGQILRKLEELQGSGEVSSRDQAIEIVRGMLNEDR
jgi:poly(A) polymerase